jgi:hypothetical protein
MNHRLNDLHLRRGRLLERIANQRATLTQEVQPVRSALFTADRLLDIVYVGVDHVKRHPGLAALAVAAFFIARPRRIWRWSKRAFFVWQTWRAVRNKLLVLGLRAGS